MYLAGPWLELHEHTAEQTGDVADAARASDLSWAALQQDFMDARDYTMLFRGVTLCRRHGDNQTTLATVGDVEALLSRDWSELIGSTL